MENKQVKNQNYGIIENCIDDNLIKLLSTTLKNKATPITMVHANTWVSNKNFNFFPILEKLILNAIGEYFHKMKIGMLTYTEATENYGCHFDDYQTYRWGEPYLSILLPITEHADLKTFIFDVRSTKNSVNPDVQTSPLELIKNRKSGESCFQPGMEHINHNLLNKIKLLGILPWKKNGLVYWDQFLLHASCNFQNKKFIIIHTIRDE